MRVAILFTGQYRCFDKTYQNILQNILIPNEATAFVYCETSASREDFTTDVERKWGSELLGACDVYNERPREFHDIYRELTRTKPAIQPEKFNRVRCGQEYLWHSGSILEYYQYMKAYDLLSKYENENNVTFDIIIRSRLDIIYGQPLHIKSFFSKIDSFVDISDVGKYIMNLGNRVMMQNNRGNAARYKHVCELKDMKFETSREMLEHIQQSEYVWTLGINQVWIGRRHVMKKLYSMIYSYGDFVIDYHEGFNSETQFTQFCKTRGIQHFMYNSVIDSKYGPFWSDQQYNRSLVHCIANKQMPEKLIFTIMR